MVQAWPFQGPQRDPMTGVLGARPAAPAPSTPGSRRWRYLPAGSTTACHAKPDVPVAAAVH
jgi:hypothetical protein